MCVEQAAPPPRPRRARHRPRPRLWRGADWRRPVAVALVVGYLLLLLVAFRATAAPQMLGVVLERAEPGPPWAIAAVQPTSPAADAGVRRGDRLLLIDGQAPPENAVAVARALERATRITVARAPEGRPITAGHGRSLSAPERFAFFLVGGLFAALGTLVVLRGHGAAARALALTCGAGATELTIVPPGYHGARWAVLLGGLCLPLFTGTLLQLFLVFPVERLWRLGRFRVTPGLVLLPIVPLALAWIVLASLYAAQAPAVEAAGRALRALGYLYFICCLAGAGAALVVNWRRTPPGRARTQRRIVICGSLLALLPFLVLTLLPQALGGAPLVTPTISGLGFVLLPLAFAYAILRYQVIDLGLYIRRGVAYSATIAFLTVLYALLLGAVGVFVGGHLDVREPTDFLAVSLGIGVLALVTLSVQAVLQRGVDRLFDRRRYDYGQCLGEFSQRLTTVLDFNDLQREVIELTWQTMGAEHVRLFLVEPGTGMYVLATSAGRPAPPEQRFLLAAHPLRRALAAAPGQLAQRLGVPPEAEAILVPLMRDRRPLGLLTLGPKRSEVPYSSEDLALLQAVGNQLAIAIENAHLFQRTRDLYLSSVRALAAAVGAKDVVTQGHSERVAAYARATALAMGLPAAEVERVELAGLLHDIGMIGVPDALLRKPWRLDPGEWALVCDHAARGAQILADSLALAPLAPLVRHHHERYDGCGYPAGLAGDAIPLGAAIIAVAEAFDTMTADRPYGEALSRERALAELERCQGTQFHPHVVAAFLGMQYGVGDRPGSPIR